MSKLPNEPRPGDPIEARIIADIIRYTREITPKPSASVLINTGSSGTTFEIVNKRNPTGDDSNLIPFEVYQNSSNYSGEDDGSAWRTFRVHRGRVSCKPAENADDSDGELIIRPDASSTHYVWLQIQAKVVSKYAPFVQSVTLHDGTDPRSGGWDSYPNQNQQDNPDEITAFVIVAELTIGSDDDGTCEIKQNVRSDLTLALPVDEVEMDSSDPAKPALLVYKKICIWGPDNFWECPSEPHGTSSAHSSAHSSHHSTEHHSSNHHSHGGSVSNESVGYSTAHTKHSQIDTHDTVYPSSEIQTHDTVYPSSEIQTHDTVYPSSEIQTHDTVYPSSVSHESSIHISYSYKPYSSEGTHDTVSNPPSLGTKTAIVEYVNELAVVEHVGLYCSEMPEVRFEDIVTIDLDPTGVPRLFRVPIDKIYQAVVEPGSICCCGLAPDRPVLIGARVEGSNLIIELTDKAPTRIVARLSAIRRGFGGLRFDRFTKAQSDANSAFWAQAHREKP